MVSLDGKSWDKVSDSISSHHLEKNVALYKRSEHVKLLRKWFPPRVSRVLKTDLFEEAFGMDYFMDFLKDVGRPVGVDISSKTVKKAVGRHGFPATSCCVVHLPFRDSCFDAIVSNSTLDHLFLKDVKQSLKEFSRVLSPGGVLVLTLDNAHNPLYRLGYILSKRLGAGGYHQEKCYGIRESKALLREAGFKVDEVSSIVHLPTPFNFLARKLSFYGIFDFPIRCFIKAYSSLGFGGRNKYTGWFLAFKCRISD